MNITRDEILKGILEQFRGICAIPHPSGEETALCRYLCDILRDAGYAPVTDDVGNLMCDIPSNLPEAGPSPLILQAHMDMVCVGAADYHPTSDPIHMTIGSEWLTSDGRSTLGADCGIGLAVILYLAFSGTSHGPLRLLFTVDEERGLRGASQVRPEWIRGCSGLINMDGFHFDRLVISSAGGCRQTFTRTPFRFPAMLEQGILISLSGLLGGHSGDDIHLGRANAARLMTWLLQSLQVPYELAALSSGTTHNAIPTEAEAIIAIHPDDTESLMETTREFFAGLKEIYPAEPIELLAEKTLAPSLVLTVDERDDFLALAGMIQCEEAAKHPLFPEISGSSGNMGLLRLNDSGIEIRSFLRSSDNDYLSSVSAFYQMAAEGFGYEIAVSQYPAWPGMEDDALSTLYAKEYAAVNGCEIHKTAIHVGLETSYFHALSLEMPMISIGMDIEGAHSAKERVRLSTIAPFCKSVALTIAHWAYQK